MALEVDGKTIETTENGYLVNMEDWTEAVGQAIADADKLEMSEKHWDVVNYLRDEHYNNGGQEPNERTIL
ncbi:MAG: TusE/DsrC/DsvC family sulfur relay protein, partial [Thiogranum sp.]